MIPTMVLVGLLLGRWWRTAITVGTLGWPFLLLASGTIVSGGEFLAAAALGFLNTLVGVALHQGLLFLLGALQGRRDTPLRHHP